jgi:FMN phosphatase YigB (HAD superfamily)
MIFFDIDDTLVTHDTAQAARLFRDGHSARLIYSQQEFPAV